MDVENFKRLFLPLHPKLFRIAYALVENKADAEDILQDAYYKLWSRRNELTDIQNPEAFCVTLVKNLCLDFLRSPRANRRDADVTEAVTLSTASSPDEELERQDKVQQAASSPVERDRRLFDGRDRTDHRPECRQHTGATLPGTKNNPGTT